MKSYTRFYFFVKTESILLVCAFIGRYIKTPLFAMANKKFMSKDVVINV